MPILIEIEGITGSGKTTLIHTLKQRLEEKEYKVLTVKEPGTTKLGNIIREALINETTDTYTNLTKMFLFLANRSDIYDMVQKDTNCQIVLSDRGYGSTVVYQVLNSYLSLRDRRMELLNIATREVERHTETTLGFKEITKNARNCMSFDPTILLDISPETALERIKKRNELRDRISSWNKEEFIKQNVKHQISYETYFKQSNNKYYPSIKINAEQSKELVAQNAVSYIVNLLHNLG